MADVITIRPQERAQHFSEGVPPDWRAREQALDIQQSWIVEAPAGSGKTGLLIQRFLKLLADESVEEPEQVLAITFTVKATAEMRERVAKQLELATRPDGSKDIFEQETRALAQAVLDRDHAFGWDLLKHPRRLNIRTIHSICGEIARSLPVLSGAGGTLSPVEDASTLYHEAARRTLMQLGGTDADLSSHIRTILLHRDGSLMDCERLLAEIFSQRDQWGQLVPLSGTEQDEVLLDGVVRAQLERALELAVRAGLIRLTDAFPKVQLAQLVLLAEEMASSPGYQGTTSPIAYCAGRQTLPGEDPNDLQHWRALIHLLITKAGWRKTANRNHLGFEIEKQHAIRLKQLQDELRSNDELLTALLYTAALPPTQYPEEQWTVIKALFRVLRRALAELQVVFAERGECDFTELELLARNALHHDNASSGLAEIGMKFQHLLVDEMQDTSTNQYGLLELLTRGWDGHSQTVFLVGDPKQSIYLFRHARVERFVRTFLTRNLGDLPLGRLQLTANFRSQRGLITTFNEDFSTLFSATQDVLSPENIPYVASVPVREQSDGVRNVAWHATVQQTDSTAREQSTCDAQSIRAIIQEWRARPLPPGRNTPWKIAVLARTKNLLHEIISELKAVAIPCRAVDIEPLGERQEVLDLFALTRSLLHPADRTAWLAILRAPWCGLSLAELHVLAGADDPSHAQRSLDDLIAERGDMISEEGCARLTRFWPVMRAAANKLPLIATSQLVERTWRSLGGDTYLSPYQTANVQRYLQLLAELESRTGSVDLSLLRHRMNSLFANPNTAEDAVELLTIHKAKGLEWDLVIVPRLDKAPRRSNGRILTWEEIGATSDGSAPFVLAPIKGKGEGSQALNSWINSIHTARENAEQKRLFYVACTRAKEELHLFAAAGIDPKGETSPTPGSLLDTIWPAADKYFLSKPIAVHDTQTAFYEPVSDSAGFVPKIAATAEVIQQPPLQRLPPQFQPLFSVSTESRSIAPSEEYPNNASHASTEGPFDLRAFGNVVHAFLDSLAKRVASGVNPDQLQQEVATWTPRIIAMLRAEGLALRKAGEYAQQVKTALDNTLHDAEGRWILASHLEGSSELALTTWQESRANVRIDRIFKAGPEPLIEGDDYLWIVDYKTATCPAECVEEFLTGERARYERQLTNYVRIAGSADSKTEARVGLFFPMLPKFVWWKPEP